MEPDKNDSELGIGKGDDGDGRRRPDGPLDGSVSGTIGGGGPQTGGSTERGKASDVEPEEGDVTRGYN